MKQAFHLGKQFAHFNFDLLSYSIATLGSKVGLCEMQEFQGLYQEGQSEENNRQHTHLKVYFLKQFSKYWIIHNVGQEITMSFEEFQKVITKYARKYNSQSEQLLKDFYESANAIWTNTIIKNSNKPSSENIKHAILKIVASTLDKNIQVHQDENFGENLYHMFHDFVQQHQFFCEKSIIKSMKANFDDFQAHHLKATKEYSKFFRDFIQEFFPHDQKAGGYNRLIKKSANMFSKVYCFFFMAALNRVENFVDLFLYFSENATNQDIMQKLSFDSENIDLDELEEKSESGDSINNCLTQKQKMILKNEQGIKSKIQIIALKGFLIVHRVQYLYQKMKNYDFRNLVFETKNCAVRYSFMVVNKVQEGFLVGAVYQKQAVRFFVEQMREIPEKLRENFEESQKKYSQEGVRGVLLYQKSLLVVKKQRILNYKRKKYSQIMKEWEAKQLPL